MESRRQISETPGLGNCLDQTFERMSNFVICDMILQVGQTMQPRIPERSYFPTTLVCRENPYDISKLNQSGLHADGSFILPKNSSIQELNLNKTWNDVTLGIGQTLNVVTSVRFWDKGKGKQCIPFNFCTNQIKFRCESL